MRELMPRSLLLALPTGQTPLPAVDATVIAEALRTFGPPREMPSAEAASRKLGQLIVGDERELIFTNAELYEIVLAVDRLTAKGAVLTPETSSFRHMLALQLVWRAQQHAGHGRAAVERDR